MTSGEPLRSQWLLAVAAALALVSCTNAKECGPDGSCPDGSVCNAQVNLCQAAGGGSAGGGGGGSTGGGGATSGGGAGGVSDGGAGGTAGGMTGGGVAGGMAGGGSSCTPACRDWQTCEGGTCTNGVLSVTTPAPDTEVPTGGTLNLLATLTTSDGGAWASGVRIPLSFGAGGGLANVVSGMASTAMAPAVPQTLTLTFGWTDAGVAQLTQTRQVAVTGCASVTPLPYEECVPTVDGGRLVNQGLEVVWLTPDAGLRTNLQTLFGAVRVRKHDGGVVAGVLATAGVVPVTGTVTASLAAGSGAPSARVFSGQLTLNNTSGETQTLTAGWPSPGPSATQTVFYDTTAPVVTVTLEPGSPFRRDDDTVSVQVNSSEAISPAAASQVTLAGAVLTRPRGPGACPGMSCTTAACECWEADMAQPDWPASAGLTTTFPVVASARDVAGNLGSSAAAPTDISVTRLKWRTSVPVPTPAVAPLRAAPALDSAGTLFIDVDETGTAGKVHALSPLDGSPRPGFPKTTGAVQSVAVALTRDPSSTSNGALDVVYANSNTATEGRIDMWAADGGVAIGSPYTDTNRTTSSAMALFRADVQSSADVGGVAHFNGAAGRLASTSPVGGVSSTNSSASYVLPVPGTTMPFSPVNLVASPGAGATSVSFATSGAARAVHAFPYLTGSGWQPAVTPSPTLGGIGATVPNSLALAGDLLLLTIEGRSTPLRALILDGGLTFTSDVALNGGLIDGAGPAVVAQRGAAGASILFGSNNVPSTDWLVSAAFNTTNATFAATPADTSAVSSSSRLVTSPLIGGGGLPHLDGGVPDRLYTVTTDGVLRVLQVSPTTGLAGATTEWSLTTTNVFGAAGKTVYAHPTLDCFRPTLYPDGGMPRPNRPGTLYVVATDGTVAAILVDSQKLSTSAPWPKWQRTAGNAGNTDSSLFPLNPGCPP